MLWIPHIPNCSSLLESCEQQDSKLMFTFIPQQIITLYRHDSTACLSSCVTTYGRIPDQQSFSPAGGFHVKIMEESIDFISLTFIEEVELPLVDFPQLYKDVHEMMMREAINLVPSNITELCKYRAECRTDSYLLVKAVSLIHCWIAGCMTTNLADLQLIYESMWPSWGLARR